jgi:ligand-binding sensor domain-containing protein/putative methionine-R-sulfoxide reductase with GAF domain
LYSLVLHSQPKSFFWGNDVINFTTDESHYQTIVYGTKNGLASSEITCLTQDSKGYIWIGTSAGLSRYGGINFKNFLKADNHFTGKIYAVREDTLHKVLWVACDAGLCYFRNQQLHFVHFKERNVSVYDIYFRDNGMWIGTGKGPAFFQEKIIPGFVFDSTISLASFLLPQWSTVSSTNSPVYKIICSENEKIYFAGEGTLFLYNKNLLKKIWTSPHQQNNNDNVVGMVTGNADTVFFASAFGGMYYVKNEEVKGLPDDNYIAGDLIKHKGQIYYFTSGGIYRFLTSTMSLKKISEVPENLNIWISCLLIDNENNLWIGLHDNLLYQKSKMFFTYINNSGSSSAELYSVGQLKNNQLLFGANRGKVYKKTGRTFENIFGTKQLVPHAEIKGIYEDSRGWLWFGSGYEGIAVSINNKIWNITKANGLSNNSNYFFYEDAAGNIYSGGDGGFSKINFDSSLNRFLFKNYYYKVAGENLETFKTCIGGADGSLWMGGEKGIFHFKNDSLIHYFVNGEINSSVTDIKKDKSNNVWIATKGAGIWQCYFDGHNLLRPKKVFTQKDGLQSDIYLSITIDNENNIWAGGYSAITSIKKNNKSYNITNYTSNDGFLSSNYQSLRIFCDTRDTIWVATSSGLTSFYAKNTGISRQLLLNFTNISLLDTSKKIDSYKRNGAIPELPYFLNGIEFQFKAICLSNPQKINYSYRLMGLEDTAWLEWDNKEIAVYQNLPPGIYSFQVKASLGNNNIITKPVTFSFLIKRPFWLSWWFIILCSALILFGIYVLQKKWKKNIQIKHEQKINTQKLISENLQYQLEIEQVTNYFTTSMSATETVDELLWDVARQCISKLNFEDCVIYMKDETSNKLIQKAAWGPKSNANNSEKGKAGKILSPIEIPVGSGIVGTVAATGIAEIVSDVTKDERYIKDDIQRFSEIAVPIIYDKNILGVIDSESHEKNFYTQHHLKILTTIASHCAERIVKLKTEENLHRNELELLQMQNRLAEEKLTALRSQMNPHFIFNCLNSIQQFILNGQVDNANKYLSQFSRLIRLVLQYSENNFISLEEEINMLQLYLSLEKTRFGDSFEYKINVEEDLDTDEIKIPNLMIQPFVENAIWHGLMHKEGNRRIHISFQLKEDQFIICEVTDNGIGRKKAAEIKNAKSLDIKHNSKGMQLIKDKIDILKQQFKSDVSIEIADVTNINDETDGTSVIIKLPLQY